MRTNIVINDRLMEEALEVSGLSTKRAVVEEGLRLVIAMKKQETIKFYKRKLKWEGDLDQLREDK